MQLYGDNDQEFRTIYTILELTTYFIVVSTLFDQLNCECDSCGYQYVQKVSSNTTIIYKALTRVVFMGIS